MKQTLLFILILNFFSLPLFSQKNGDDGCNGCGNGASGNALAQDARKSQELSIYPNPAVDYIGITNDEGVEQVVFFNLLGRKVKTFDVQKGEKYYIADLPSGIYLVQLLDKKSKALLTHRLNKR